MGAYRINTIIAVIGTVALLPIALLPIFARVSRRYGALRGWPMLAGVGLLASSVALAAFTVFPVPDPEALQCTGEAHSSYWQTDWFASIAQAGASTSALLQVVCNVLLFVPYGFFLHQVTRWRPTTVVGVGLATSAAIEVTQGTAVFGLYPCPYRVLDVDDLILNTLGAGVGALASIAVARRAWANPEPVPDLAPPSLPRRVLAAAVDFGLIWVIASLVSIAWAGPSVLLGLIGALVVAFVVPGVRGDRGTPGQAIVNIAPARGPHVPDAPRGAAVATRAAVRWVPIIVVPALTAVFVLAELVTALVRADRSSLAGLASRTVIRTKPAIAAEHAADVLPGGNMGGAVRRGNTVLKPTQPQSETVQRLVAHVRAQGVGWPAEPLGISHGKDRWRYIPGEVTHDDLNDSFPTDVVEDVARRLREWHDATVTFERSPRDVWWWPGKEPAEVICHVDFAPYNHVFRDGRFVGAIDFDICYPGPRLWDLAYTAYRYAPLIPSDDDALTERRLERLDAFVAAYAGGEDALTYSRAEVLGYAVARLIAMVEWCEQQESADRRRDAVMYRSHAQWIAVGGLGAAEDVVVPDLTS